MTSAQPPSPLLLEFAEVYRHKLELDDQLKQINERLASLQQPVQDHMAQQKMTSCKIGGLTLYINHDKYAAPVGGDKERLIRALLGDDETRWLVPSNYNHQRLSAWVREFPDDENGIPQVPDELKDVLQVNERFSVRARRS